MALDLLAVPDAKAGVNGNLSLIQLIHCREDRWENVPYPPAAAVWDQLAIADEQIRKIMIAMAQPAPQSQLAVLRSRLRDLTDRMLSAQGRQILAEAAAPDANGKPPILRLHLMPGLDVIPWELLHDGTDFLGLRFQVARLPVVAAGPREAEGAVHQVRRIVTVLGENVLDEPDVKRWRGTFSGLVNGTASIFRRPDKDDWPDFAAATSGGPADVIHFTCHGITKGNERFWTLNDGRLTEEAFRLNATVARDLLVDETHPLVFANACSSAAAPVPEPGTLGTLAEGFGTTFYEVGARVFIGTFAPVTKAMAVEFARRFFQNLLKLGLPAGEALLATKQFFLAQQGPDPSWLFYCLYGDPTARFSTKEGA